ncbi:MAG TPA: type I 3-dehydroquinate dehydratase [bacterium]|jgi:3-dehydroquinate dehydratase-1|nr:type I 3-dehydroquinate dehydratase [bacterium]
MPAIGNVLLGSVPRVVLAVGKSSSDLKSAAQAGVSILEARIDLFARTDSDFVAQELARLRAFGLPVLATFRPESEGGAWTGGEEDRKRILLASLDVVDAVDVELDAPEINAEVCRACARAGKTLIVSKHYLDSTPDDRVLQAKIDEANAMGADLVKLACQARDESDVVRLLTVVGANRAKGMVGISMGPLGAVSRVAAPLFGSLLTYTSRDLNYGQLKLEELVLCLKSLYPQFGR